MIKAMIGNTVKREPYILDANTTLRAALEEAGVDYTRGTIQLDSAPPGSRRPGQDLRGLRHHREVLPPERGEGR